MKILFLGEIAPGQTSHMRMRALSRLGHDVDGFNTVQPWQHARWLARQVQRRLGSGPVVDAINRDVLDRATALRPDLVWAEKQEFLWPETIARLRALGARLVHFTPDPYFSLPWKRTRHMDRAIGAFDVLVYCKAYERDAYAATGRPLVYMPLGFCDEVHRPMADAGPAWSCAAGFQGGWEPRRQQLMRALADAGIDLAFRGYGWDMVADGRWTLRRHVVLHQLARGAPFRFRRDDVLARAFRGGEVYGDDYARALSGAAIGLGFLRTICPDQHTTRTFEIPACGSMLLADRTDEHSAFFEEGKEAEFFDGEAELVDKARFYVTHDDARRRIAEAGRVRGIRSRYAYVHRLAACLAEIEGGRSAAEAP